MQKITLTEKVFEIVARSLRGASYRGLLRALAVPREALDASLKSLLDSHRLECRHGWYIRPRPPRRDLPAQGGRPRKPVEADV